MRTSKGLLVSPMWNLPQSHGMVYTHCFVYRPSLAGQVFISIKRRVRLVLKNWPDIETVTNASECFGSALNIWANDRVLVCCIWRTPASRWFHYGVNEFLWVFISVRSCLIFLICLLKPFWSWHMTLALMIKLSFSSDVGSRTWIAGFCYIFVANLRTLLMTKTSRKGRVLLTSTSIMNLRVRPRLLRRWGNVRYRAGPCHETTIVSSTYLSHLAGLWSAVSSTISSKYSINMLLTTHCPLPLTRSTWLLSRCPVIPLRLQLVKVSVLGKKDQYWSISYDP
jgi:hypothetical protein